MKNRPVTILGTESWHVEAKDSKSNYQISVGLPRGYDADKKKKWPVIFLLDSNWYFGLVTELIRTMASCAPTSDAVVVGIGYETIPQLDRAYYEVWARRSYDLTPIHDPKIDEEDTEWLKSIGYDLMVMSGGAEEFLNFIEDELIPSVEKKYRVDSKARTLVGHSLGGSFVMYALLMKPGIFRNYAALSAPWHNDDFYIFELEERLASRKRKTLPANLFLSVGELEEKAGKPWVSGMYKMASQLKGRKYKNFQIQTRLFPGEDHCSVKAPSFQAGLKMALLD